MPFDWPNIRARTCVGTLHPLQQSLEDRDGLISDYEASCSPWMSEWRLPLPPVTATTASDSALVNPSSMIGGQKDEADQKRSAAISGLNTASETL